ncbi:MAG TPA: hypothetical protein VHH73_17930 [Verrucomicrobiae bacterium]|nr:hypothetical protein [Verrucomicrobiae bacterium]
MASNSPKRRVLFVVSSDPRSSHLPAEALRIAAGLAVWKEVEVEVALRGPAVLLLHMAGFGLVNEEEIARSLAILVESGGAICVEETNPLLPPAGQLAASCQRLDQKTFAARAAESGSVIRF